MIRRKLHYAAAWILVAIFTVVMWLASKGDPLGAESIIEVSKEGK